MLRVSAVLHVTDTQVSYTALVRQRELRGGEGLGLARNSVTTSCRPGPPREAHGGARTEYRFLQKTRVAASQASLSLPKHTAPRRNAHNMTKAGYFGRSGAGGGDRSHNTFRLRRSTS